MLTGRNVVCLSTIDWDFLWQEHQAVMSILARAGNRVLFIENTGVRTPGWRDRGRVLGRLRKWTSGEGRFRPVVDNVFLYSPLALPFPYSALAQRMNRRLVGGSIRRWLRAHRFDDPILFSFLPSQFMLDLMDLIEPAVTVFYCSEKLSETSPAARRLAAYEGEVLRRSDLVFASSRRLADHCRQRNPNTHLFAIGVSLEKFDAAWKTEPPQPPDVAALPRPRIGLVGGLRQCVDQELLRQLSLRFLGHSFVLVGPEQVAFDSLKELPNVHFLGAKPHAEIPYLIAQFDVCLIPYLVDDFTDHISPAKLNEYLALGKPVVSTALREVRQFNHDHGYVVLVGTDAGAFGDRIEEALREDSPILRERRRAVAEGNSWQAKVEAMSRLIDSRLGATPATARPEGRAATRS